MMKQARLSLRGKLCQYRAIDSDHLVTFFFFLFFEPLYIEATKMFSRPKNLGEMDSPTDWNV